MRRSQTSYNSAKRKPNASKSGVVTRASPLVYNEAMSDDAPVQEFFEAMEASLDGASFIKLTLGKYRGTTRDLKNLYVRPAALKVGPRLSFLYRHQTKDVTKNFERAEAFAHLRRLIGTEFLSAHLFTLAADLRLEFNRRREARLTRHEPTLTARATDAGHAKRKRRLIETEGNIYLRELGVTDERWRVRPALGDKLRQINRFVEIIADLIESSTLAERERLTVFDMGSGKGYLTFAVYDYLVNGLKIEASVTGVEARAELVELCNRVAVETGFVGLNFVQGYVGGFDSSGADVLIALHACDTATDDALYQGVAAEASIIVTAPCCHRELRPQINAPAPLRALLRHGILLEREAESVTDSLRALLLEAAGYRARVFEFISTEHTRKNTMIAGVRHAKRTDSEEALRQFRELKEFYGIGEQRLEKLFCENRFI